VDMLFPGTTNMPMKTTGLPFGITTSRTFHTFATTQPLSGRKPVLALLVRLLWAAALALPTLGAHASAVLTTLHSFTGTNDGESPFGGLAQGIDGNFYGTTSFGGTTNSWPPVGAGTLFKISSNGDFTTLYSFTGRTDGAYPHAELMLGNDGYFYGTTAYGGIFNCRAIARTPNPWALCSTTSAGCLQKSTNRPPGPDRCLALLPRHPACASAAGGARAGPS
jgi:uncharacterized repeat protein (TIGR03803 family)